MYLLVGGVGKLVGGTTNEGLLPRFNKIGFERGRRGSGDDTMSEIVRFFMLRYGFWLKVATQSGRRPTSFHPISGLEHTAVHFRRNLV
jgi:hypothetical protein